VGENTAIKSKEKSGKGEFTIEGGGSGARKPFPQTIKEYLKGEGDN